MMRIANRLVLLTTFVVGVALFMQLQPTSHIPTSFEVHLPPEPKPVRIGEPFANNCGILIVGIQRNGKLMLNDSQELGTVGNTGELTAFLSNVFRERKASRVYIEDAMERPDLTEDERVYKLVVVKASPSIKYGDVVKVIDAVKGTGANPIALQTDELEGGSRSFYGAVDDGNDHPLRRLKLAPKDF